MLVAALAAGSGLLPPELADVLRAGRARLGLGYDVGDPGSLNIPVARALLATIAVADERPDGFEREAWRQPANTGPDCRTVRAEVLIDESTRPVDLDRAGCDVIGGLWLDPFTGAVFTNPRDLTVDYLVPLEEVHRSGGHTWSRRQRAAFVNDLTNPRTHIAVSREASRSRGARTPGDWLPPNRNYRCAYVLAWIVVKERWDLSVDEGERAALGDILDACERAMARP